MNKGGITEDKINTVLEREYNGNASLISDVTVWNSFKEVEIKEVELNRSENVTLIEVAGDMQVTAPMQLVRGNIS